MISGIYGSVGMGSGIWFMDNIRRVVGVEDVVPIFGRIIE